MTPVQLRTDFDQIADGATVILHPNAANPLHKKPIKAHNAGGYFYCEGTDHAEGPDYYLGDVLTYTHGYEPQP
jgi:hypothetical protein